MIVEGRGLVVPSRCLVRLTTAELSQIKSRAAEQAAERGYLVRSDQWGRGLIRRGRDGLSSHEAAIFVGMVGEYAGCCFINRRLRKQWATLDMEPRRTGDGGRDIRVAGLDVQVKCRQADHGTSLIRRSDRGRTVPLRGDVHLFCEYPRDTRTDVWVLGWSWNGSLESLPLVPARAGDHMNIEVEDCDLLPPSSLIAEIRSRVEAQTWR